ncbi:hypothetical protein STHERM_c09980 [Spirochaeta thermophila DSM 6192]|uniref:SPOR domain-containing protein n=1 Tax=Winmispira thermophila (strain ATCC 49972 / DSM 6192 / RI 19.B1) TaxID=665571 RepID=E0RSF7_WINT6|nr:hypothetical protein STHERM_c09980 [Spirochaeta thermophila DSM 6192]
MIPGRRHPARFRRRGRLYTLVLGLLLWCLPPGGLLPAEGVGAVSREQILALELSGDLEGALAALTRRYSVSRDPVDLFGIARLTYELGDFVLAESRTRELLSQDVSTVIKRDALLLLAHIYLATGRFEDAHALTTALLDLSDPTPALLYTAFLASLLNGEGTSAERIRDRLEEMFPESPESVLVRGLSASHAEISWYPSYMLSLGEGVTMSPAGSTGERATTDEEGGLRVGIQVGSFLERKNAQEMVDILGEKGFTAVIVEAVRDGRTFFRVLLPVEAQTPSLTQERAQEILVSLKDQRIEGFVVFY